MKTRLLIAALLTGLVLAPFAVAEEGDESEDQSITQGCIPADELCLIPCWPLSTYSTGDLIPPIWFDIDWLCLPP